jgi:hypothetical protein
MAPGWLASLRMAAQIAGKISPRTRRLLSRGQASDDVLPAIAERLGQAHGKGVLRG